MTNLQPIPQPDPLLELRELTQKIDKQRPAPADLQALHDFLAQHPGLWQTISDLAHHAANNLLNQAKSHPLVIESLKYTLANLRTDLAYHTASPLERLLIEQVVLWWLRLNLTELGYTEALDQPLSPAMAAHWDKRLSAAQRRFLQACQALARIRKLAHTTPPLQLNIAAPGSQQINLLRQPSPDDHSPP